MDKKHEKFFIKLLGEDNAYFDEAHKIAYCYDATRKRYAPDGVVFPRDESDVSEILKYCNEHKITIIPRGAGSGFTGGALASMVRDMMTTMKVIRRGMILLKARLVQMINPKEVPINSFIF